MTDTKHLTQSYFDVVDLLQVYEVWVRLPITKVVPRMEHRQTAYTPPFQFESAALTSGLSALRRSASWQRSPLARSTTDPGLLPFCQLSEDMLTTVFPDLESPLPLQQALFHCVYQHYLVDRYTGAVQETQQILQSLSAIRAINTDEFFRAEGEPKEGSDYWIPVDLTDEVRALDARYNSALANTPATYVVDESFWHLLLKADSNEIDATVWHYCQSNPLAQSASEDCARQLRQLVNVAHNWYRSPSVVGLYYQGLKMD